MYDRLQDTPVYKEMLRLASEKARQEGIQEGIRKAFQEGLQEGQLMALREVLLLLILTRFPKLFRLAKLVSSTINETSVLETLILSISTASTHKKARRFLRAIIE